MKRRALLALLVAGAARAQGTDPLPPFDAIELAGSADVRFVQGDPAAVVVEGDANARRRVEVDVQGRTLRIRTSGDWRFWSAQRVALQVTAPQLTRLSISGAGNVHAPALVQGPKLVLSVSGAGHARLDRVDVDLLQFQASGSGDALLAGQARDFVVGISGRGDVRAEELAAQRARVSISGLGDVRLWVTEALFASVSGIGKVEYWGAPPVVQRSSSGAATFTPRGPKTPPP